MDSSERSGLFLYKVLPFGNVAPHEILLVKTENILFYRRTKFFHEWTASSLDTQFRGALLVTHKLASELAPHNLSYWERVQILKEGVTHERDHQNQQNSRIP